MLDARVYIGRSHMRGRPRLDGLGAVLLDMDGTLVDSDACVERAWAIWASEYGVDPEAVLAVAHGNPAARTVERFLPQLDEEAIAASAQRQLTLQYQDLSDVVAASGAHDLLDFLAESGLPWAVVTSADDRLAKARLAAAGIEPPLLLTIEDVRQGKPHPEGYLNAAARLGVDPAACLVVEDSEPGLAAGRAAGMSTAALRGLDGDLRLLDLGHLAHLLRRARAVPWWRDAVGYQAQPSFFVDGADDRGDVTGADERLEHLARLGVDVVWLSPLLRSPMRGHDIAARPAADPVLDGAALDELLARAHGRGMRVIGDLVVERHRCHSEPAERVEEIIDHWSARGLDGFRIATAATDGRPMSGGRLASSGGGVADRHGHAGHQPGVHAMHERWRRIADGHGAFLVGEVAVPDPSALARLVAGERLHSSFWSGLADTGWDPERIDAMLPAAAVSPRLSWAQGGQGGSGAATRYGGGLLGRRRSLALHVVTAVLPGTMWLHQGEELGLDDEHAPRDRSADPVGAALRRLLMTRRRLAGRPAVTDAAAGVDLGGGVTAYRRGGLWAVANLRDAPVPAVDLPASAVFDSDDPAITPERPRTGRVRLAPQQALVLVEP
ncbi:HAD-IA family hydrolase [Spirillospora sp. NPDC127200]